MTTLSRALPQPGVQARGEGVNFFDLGRDFLLREMQGFFETTHQFWKRLLPQVVHIDLSAHAACVVLGTAVNSRRRETDERYSTVSKYYGRAIKQIQHNLTAIEYSLYVFPSGHD